MTLLIGIIGFFFLYIYEINQIKWKTKIFKSFFFLGFILIIISTITTMGMGIGNYNPILWQIVLAVLLFAFFVFLLIFTLFFAIPFESSYVDQYEERLAYTEGIYALCRHPGVLWLMGMYASLIIITPTIEVVILSIVLNVMNILYVVMQDIWSFPKLFVNYDDYKGKTPFLIPNAKSIHRTIKSYQEGD